MAAIVTGILVTIFLFATLASKHGNRERTTTEAAISPSLRNTAPDVSVPSSSAPTAASITPDELTKDSEQQNTDFNLVIDRVSDGPSTDTASSAAPSTNSIPLSHTQIAEPVTKRTKTRPIPAPLPLKGKANAASIKSAVLEGSPHPSPVDQEPSIAGAMAIVRASVPPPQLEAPATASADSTNPSAGSPDSIAETYLEVGSFKDTKWADDAVERLSQQGFHAICVHKTVFWIQSYHVQVGPYATSDQIDQAQERLTEQGIKSHIVK